MSEELKNLETEKLAVQNRLNSCTLSLNAAQEKNKALFLRQNEILNKNSDWLSGLICLLISAVITGLVLISFPDKFLSASASNAQVQGKIINLCFFLFYAVSYYSVCAKIKLLTKISIAFCVIFSIIEIYLNFYLFALVFAVSLICLIIKIAIDKRLKNKGFKNLYQVFSSNKETNSAKEEIAKLLTEKKAAEEELLKIENEIAKASEKEEQAKKEEEAKELYKSAVKTAENYPEEAVKAFNMFTNSYYVLLKTGEEFFALKEKMESEPGETLYKFALELCQTGGDAYEFLRLIQLAVNKGCENARSALGNTFSAISAAASKGDYASAYSILGPLIEAGSADALNIKLQLDNNRIAEEAKAISEKARKEAALRAIEQNAKISAAQSAVLGEMAAIRRNQEFAQTVMINTVEDARRNGVKFRFD